ncbi:MAG: hypothetical protein HWE12_00095 [Oceanospirillaceae bacterium]|nr:hypothetical protein [Oceanospirillaceae bacterium]
MKRFTEYKNDIVELDYLDESLSLAQRAQHRTRQARNKLRNSKPNEALTDMTDAFQLMIQLIEEMRIGIQELRQQLKRMNREN